MITKTLEVTNKKAKVYLVTEVTFSKTRCNIFLENQGLLIWHGPDFTLEILVSSSSNTKSPTYIFKIVINGIEKLSLIVPMNRTSSNANLLRCSLSASEFCFQSGHKKSKIPIVYDILGIHQVDLYDSQEIRFHKTKLFLSRSQAPKAQTLQGEVHSLQRKNKTKRYDRGNLKNEIGDILNKLKIEGTSPCSRKEYCQINLGSSCEYNKEHTGISNERVYLTPEISYEVKNHNLDIIQKNNINYKYTNSGMASQICISNPLHSLRAFIMDFVVKNLILFGLLVLFQTLLANPEIPMNTRLMVALVVVVVYNLIHWVFKALENIFVWACQYSTGIDELVSDSDQWMS